MKFNKKTFFQSLLGVAFLVFLIQKGAISWSEVVEQAKMPDVILGSSLFLATVTGMMSIRWWLLLRKLGLNLPLSATFLVTMAAGFFGNTMGGSIAFDGVRVGWFIQKFPDSKKVVLGTIVVDRILGLVGFGVFILLVSLYGVFQSKAVGWMEGLGLLFLFAVAYKVKKGAKKAEGESVFKSLDVGTCVMGIILSVVSVGMTVGLNWFLCKKFGIDVKFSDIAVSIPLSGVASYISAAPFGMGAQQAALHGFSLLGWIPELKLPSVITVAQFQDFLFHGAGSILFLIYLGTKKLSRWGYSEPV